MRLSRRLRAQDLRNRYGLSDEGHERIAEYGVKLFRATEFGISGIEQDVFLASALSRRCRFHAE